MIHLAWYLAAVAVEKIQLEISFSKAVYFFLCHAFFSCFRATGNITIVTIIQEEIMPDVSRRKFIQTTSASAVLLFAGLNNEGVAAPSKAKEYKAVKIGNIKDLKTDEAVSFSYPDESSPCVLVKLGNEAIGGVGPGKNVVAFSALCTHMGCPVIYNKGRLVCKCHYSMFDVSRNGQSYQGLASQWIAQIVLRLDAVTGNIYAEGIEGLVYGRIGNLKLS